jgi:hypothetical protein
VKLRLLIPLALLVLGSQVFIGAASAQARRAGPPVPFEDVGACPFEGCTYREWTANATVTVRRSRSQTAPVVFRVRPGEKVTALTGVVITVRAARVQFREPATVAAFPESVSIKPGETLYLLTNQGEGFSKGWFKGSMLTDIDTTEFHNGVCEVQPSKCKGRIVGNGQTEWWVQIRSRRGVIGWTVDSDKFDGQDRYGARE